MTLLSLSRRSVLGRVVTLAGLGLGLPLAGCMTTPKPPVLPPNVRDLTLACLPLINDLRKKKGLSALGVDPAASGAAVSQALRMVSYKKMAHLLTPFDDFKARMKGGNVSLPASENVATGQDSVEEAMQAWIRSPKHLENMLGNYRGLGVAVAYDLTDANRPYWAMVLSNPPEEDLLGLMKA